jgi:CRP/FNR family transcriptional regulator, cyclic AMP receptor protein
MPGPEAVERLAQITVFSDLRWPELEAVAHTFDEEVFAEGQRVLRQGISGGAFYVILDGEATVVIDGEERARLGRGEFFGEISVLTGGVPIADIRAETLLRCLVLPGPQLETFLLEHPPVMLRMLQAVSRRLRDASRWS